MNEIGLAIAQRLSLAEKPKTNYKHDDKIRFIRSGWEAEDVNRNKGAILWRTPQGDLFVEVVRPQSMHHRLTRFRIHNQPDKPTTFYRE